MVDAIGVQTVVMVELASNMIGFIYIRRKDLRKTMVVLLAIATALFVSVSAASADDVDSVNVNVTGDIQYDYTLVTYEEGDNTAAFELQRARLGAETDLGVGYGRLLLDFSHLDDVRVDFAYAQFDAFEGDGFVLSGGAGRLPLIFGQVATTDNYQPNIRMPIERFYGFVDNSVDGLELAAIVGSDDLNVVGTLQYHNEIGDDFRDPNKDWNGDIAFNLTEYVVLSVSYLEKIGSTDDLQSHTLRLNLGPLRLIGSHLAVGDSFGYNFDDKLDFYSVEGGIKVGDAKVVELVARVDGNAGGDLHNYSAGVNWIFQERLILQANAAVSPENMEISAGEIIDSLVESAVAMRMTLLF